MFFFFARVYVHNYVHRYTVPIATVAGPQAHPASLVRLNAQWAVSHEENNTLCFEKAKALELYRISFGLQTLSFRSNTTENLLRISFRRLKQYYFVHLLSTFIQSAAPSFPVPTLRQG